MDLIIIIVNQKQLRKKVKNHLKAIGCGEFITMNSTGTIGMLTRDNAIRTSIDRVFDDKVDTINESKVIAFINGEERSTTDLIDEIHGIINSQANKAGRGIAFSIALKNLFSVQKRV